MTERLRDQVESLARAISKKYPDQTRDADMVATI